MKIGIVCGAFAPVQAGHWQLIEKAARECDKVHLFVSTSDRKRPGELPIYGVDKLTIWKTWLEPALPDNVVVEYGGVPISKAWALMGAAEEDGNIEDSFYIYSDPVDIAASFPERSMLKYVPLMWQAGQINLVPIERTSTVNVSGTQMRRWIESNNKFEFKSHLPNHLSSSAREQIWQLLRQHAMSESLMYYVNCL